MVAELRNGTEDYSAVAKATTAIAVALDTKAFLVVAADSLSLVARAHIGTGGPAAVYHQLEAGAPNARTTERRVAGQAGEPYMPSGSAESRAEPRAAHSTERRSVDHRHRRLEDDGGRSRGRYSST